MTTPKVKEIPSYRREDHADIVANRPDATVTKPHHSYGFSPRFAGQCRDRSKNPDGTERTS